MSFDEFIYTKFVKYFNSSNKIDEEVLQRQVMLEDIKPRLTVFARALTGEAIDIYSAEREGGYKNNLFFLPGSFSAFSTKEENQSFYLFRVLYLSAQHNLGLNWNETQGITVEIARQKAFECYPSVLEALEKDFPVSRKLHDRLKSQFVIAANGSKALDLTWLYGKWMHEERAKNNDKSMDVTNKNDLFAGVKVNTTLKANPVEEVIQLQIDQKMQEDYVMNHNFEKVETAEEFNGNWRDFDGSDQLEDHCDALDELNMKFMVRADEMTHSVYQSEFTENTSISESADSVKNGYHITYNEWDYKKSFYKPNYCKVYPQKPSKTDPFYYRKVIAENSSTLMLLRKMLANVNNKWKQNRYQVQGENFDIDAVTDMFVDLHSGQTPSEKLYFSDRKTEKDISILLLLDNSLSTDSYAAGNRVIDVEKQVSILFGEILNEYQIDFSICSFFSRTRNHTSFNTLKGFDESWSLGKNFIGAIEPSGYTRIGASIRHAGALLDKRPTKNKWIILVSDGKPNDFDKYEGRYGINDVKQALRELNDHHINAFALAIEAQARYYLPQMFGQNHYEILTSPKELLTALVQLYTKIKQL